MVTHNQKKRVKEMPKRRREMKKRAKEKGFQREKVAFQRDLEKKERAEMLMTMKRTGIQKENLRNRMAKGKQIPMCPLQQETEARGEAKKTRREDYGLQRYKKLQDAPLATAADF